MASAMAGKKERLPERLTRFIEEHPTTKLYVPAVVTATLLVQIIAGCG